MKDNIQLALDRAGKLDDLQAKTDQLSTHSQQFQVTTKKVKNKYWWKNVKVKICNSTAELCHEHIFLFYSRCGFLLL